MKLFKNESGIYNGMILLFLKLLLLFKYVFEL